MGMGDGLYDGVAKLGRSEKCSEEGARSCLGSTAFDPEAYRRE